MTDARFSIWKLRQTIWSSLLYRRARHVVADFTRPVRRIELAFIFRQDLSEPVRVSDAKVQIDVAQASRDEVERAVSGQNLMRVTKRDKCVTATRNVRAADSDPARPAFGV